MYKPDEEKWLIMYGYAKEYYLEHHDLAVPSKYCFVDNGKLSEEKKILLNNLGINENTNVNGHEERWLEHYKCAVEYFKEHNDLEIPFLYKVEMENSSFALGEWLSYQRRKYKRGLLSNKQIKLLESINISWKTNKNKNRYLTENKKWFNMYKYAVKYFKEHGNLLIPANLVVYDENNNEVKLGSWIIRQRSNYKNNKLTTERIEYLNKINMIWKVFDKERIKRYNDLTWLKYYKEVLAYYKKYGNINVRKDYKVISENNEILDLYSWLTVQYFEYEKSSLSTYQINLLKQIGFMSYIDQRVKKL